MWSRQKDTRVADLHMLSDEPYLCSSQNIIDLYIGLKEKTKSTFNKQNTFPKMFPKKEGNTIVHSFHYISTKFGTRGIPIEYDTPGAWGPSPPN